MIINLKQMRQNTFVRFLNLLEPPLRLLHRPRLSPEPIRMPLLPKKTQINSKFALSAPTQKKRRPFLQNFPYHCELSIRTADLGAGGVRADAEHRVVRSRPSVRFHHQKTELTTTPKHRRDSVGACD